MVSKSKKHPDLLDTLVNLPMTEEQIYWLNIIKKAEEENDPASIAKMVDKLKEAEINRGMIIKTILKPDGIHVEETGFDKTKHIIQFFRNSLALSIINNNSKGKMN